MYNWSTDEKLLKKDKTKYALWKIEQLINFGLNGEKLKESELKKYWSQLNIDSDRRKFLNFILNEE